MFPPALSDAALKAGYINGDIVLRVGAGHPEEVLRGLLRLEFADLTQRTDPIPRELRATTYTES